MSACRKTTVLGSMALAGLALLMLARHPDRANSSSAAAPFIVADTTTDSPGTNLVTRIATFTAKVGGAPPLFLQWKVDKGSGFVAVSDSATNSVLIVSNARIADTGRYALFATNGVGGTNTTPMPLMVVEGVD